MSAEDRDGSEFNALSYAFQSGGTVTDLFRIDESSGLVKTRQPLDREVQDTYTLVVTAYDTKMTSLSSSVSVTVKV